MLQLERDLPSFLSRQRWFAGKARGIETATVARRAALPGDPPLEAVVVKVTYRDGTTDLYQLLVDPAVDGDGGLDAIAGDTNAERLLTCIAQQNITDGLSFEAFATFDPRVGVPRVSQVHLYYRAKLL